MESYKLIGIVLFALLLSSIPSVVSQPTIGEPPNDDEDNIHVDLF